MRTLCLLDLDFMSAKGNYQSENFGCKNFSQSCKESKRFRKHQLNYT